MKTALTSTRVELLREDRVAQTVWRLALPTMAASVVQTLNSFLDRIFVGRLGPEALAAVGVGSQMLFLTMALAMAVSTGATAIVARMAGANDQASLRAAARQALGLAFALGIGFTLLGYLLLPQIIRWYGLEPGADAQARQFLWLALLGAPGSFLMMGLSAPSAGWATHALRCMPVSWQLRCISWATTC